MGWDGHGGVGEGMGTWDGGASNLINEHGHAQGSVYEALHVISGFHGILLMLSLAMLLIASTHPSWPTLAAALMM
jgi:hypothetical protein